MTKHSKISSSPEAGQATLIERVVRNYDLVRLAPAPIPEALVPPAAKRRRYRKAGEAVPVVELADPVDRTPAPAAIAVPPIEPAAPEVVTPEVITGTADRAAPVPPVEPVQFTGQRHRISRQHLRDQGLIEPEAAVTALLEEFRIIKRQLLFNASQLQQQGMGHAAQRVLICSPLPGEGKTFTSVKLTASAAVGVDGIKRENLPEAWSGQAVVGLRYSF